ncbi:MAG: COG1361 S-layer family protein [Nanoarchaeota archaeon]|nr:COG1361 S-layer family protein [Nanoarchaeota archaeon]MBU1632442.1 COG1361 S-layer family protein [Nanoarchaeota archaeon]
MKNEKLFLIVTLFLIGIMLIPNVTAVSVANLEVTLLTQYPDPARAGDTMELRVNVRNSGQAIAENVLVEVVPDFPFNLVPGEPARKEIEMLSFWPSNANFKTLMYKILVDKNALDGQHEIKVKYSTTGGDSWTIKSFNIDVTSKEFAEIIYIDKTKIIPGQETEMTFTINNIGNAPLQNMVFSWNEPDNVVLPVNTDNTRYIKYIAPGESIPLKYTVIASVNAEPDLYMLNLNLEYDIKNSSSATQKESIVTQAGVFVGGETDFDVAFSDSSNGETSFSISNIGSVPAYSVSIIIPKQDGWRVTGSNSMIIGNLNKGDYTIASFKLQSAMSRPTEEEDVNEKQSFMQDSQTVKVQVIYTDTMGKRNTVEKEVSLNPSNLMAGTVSSDGSMVMPASFPGRRGIQQSFFSKYKWYLLVGIILILAIIVYIRYSKRADKGVKLKEFLKEEAGSLLAKIKRIFKRKKK